MLGWNNRSYKKQSKSFRRKIYRKKINLGLSTNGALGNIATPDKTANYSPTSRYGHCSAKTYSIE
jgi:hypothetical protein